MNQPPGVSIVVPVFNAERTLALCLDALEAQDYAGPRDVIVVDNGSTDLSRDAVVGRRHVRLLSCPRVGPAAARNTGLEAARYELVAFTDADCVPTLPWLSELIAGLLPELAGVGGPLESVSTGTIPQLVSEISFRQREVAQGPLPYLATSNALYRREVLLEVGGFDETFEIAGGEDNDLGWRLHERGYDLAFVQTAVCHHDHPVRLLDFVAQRVRYGYGETLLLSKHRSLVEIKAIRRHYTVRTVWRDLCRHTAQNLGAWLCGRGNRHALRALSDAAFMCGNLIGFARGVRRWESRPTPPALASPRPMCLKPWTSFELDDQNGNVLPCCWTTKLVGNVQDQSLEEVWNGHGFREFRRKMLDGDFDDMCPSECPHRTGALKETLPDYARAPQFAANLNLLKREIAEQRTILRARPLSVRLLPSIKCNLECIMCWQRVEEDHELPQRFYDEVENVLPTVRSLTLQGGEPLMIKRCREVIKSSSNKIHPDLELSLITNGTFLSEKFVRLIDEVTVRWLFVSLDAATPETYRTIRGGQFERVLDGIRRVARARPDIHLMIGFVVMEENVDEITDFVKLAEELGVECEFSPLNAAFKKGDDFATPAFRARLAEAMDSAEAYMGDRGLINRSLESVKHRMWNQQLLAFRQPTEGPEKGRPLGTVPA